jgi:SEC-C motif
MNKTTVARLGRNEPCRCGSGRKYKRCCLDKDESEARVALAKAIAESPEPSPDATPASRRVPKHETEQPWRAGGRRNSYQRVRTPRKVGGS